MRHIVLVITLFLSYSCSFSQATLWRKSVSRSIDIKDTSSNKKTAGESSIIAIDVNAIRAGRVTAYSAFNPISDQMTKMTKDAIEEEFGTRIDTVTMVDPVTGNEIIKTIRHEFIPDSIHNYRVHEDWTFDPVTGKMDGAITYIGPMCMIYGSDGVYRGKQTLFWLTQKDFNGILKPDNKQLQKLNEAIWNSYFETDTSANAKPVKWRGDAATVINIQEPEDTVIHFLQDANNDTVLSELIVNEIKNGRISAWEDSSFSKRLTKERLFELTNNKPDTMAIDDVTENHILKIVRRDFNYETIQKYRIMYGCSFEPVSGKTEIAIKGIAPMRDIIGDDGVFRGSIDMFWIRYADIQQILHRMEQYHPNNTFAMHIWDNFFLSDTKPVLVK